ncbi:MAG: lipocalin-like domain-containing protein [Shimia sp.]
MNVRLLTFLLLFPLTALAQSFANLGSDAEGFDLPQPDFELSFPADHGPHPNFRIEWWYLTANMTGPDGTPYGLQWTLFRSARAPDGPEGWRSNQTWMGHAAITTPDHHFVTERFARGGTGQAGVEADPFDAWIDEWRMVGDSFDDVRLTASGPDFAYDVRLVAEGPIVRQGENGFSVKSPSGQASIYYSQPFYRLEGTLTLPEGEVEVTGNAWLDREWSSQLLERTQTGWDWFSLTFDTGEKMMGFQIRDTAEGVFTAGTWITPDGTPRPLPDGDFQAEALETTRVAGRDVPTTWRLTYAEEGIDIVTRAINPGAWMDVVFSYWEGPITIEGSHTGIGYLEMTGYEQTD